MASESNAGVSVYAWRFHVRNYELNETGHVSATNILRYFEEGAIQASTALGYDLAWYRDNNRMWVVRNMLVRYYEPVMYPDELELQTWVSDLRRVQSHREYALYRVSDGAPVARGRANWVFLSTDTMQPQRLDSDFIRDFAPTNEVEALDTGVIEPFPIEEPTIHSEERRVQRYELDSAGHVNNSVYLAWVEQAMVNGLRAAGWPPERLTSGDFAMMPISDEIEYFRSALDHEPIWIVTRLAEIGHDRAAWHHEIRHNATGELIAKGASVRAFYDANGPRSIPDSLHLALIQRGRLE
jgi:acyl-CoA thioester hydrolase